VPYRRAFPATSDPIGLLAALILHLSELYEVELRGYDADADGTVKVDVGLRVTDACRTNTSEQPD
jgi:hypothetical protein